MAFEVFSHSACMASTASALAPDFARKGFIVTEIGMAPLSKADSKLICVEQTT